MEGAQAQMLCAPFLMYKRMRKRFIYTILLGFIFVHLGGCSDDEDRLTFKEPSDISIQTTVSETPARAAKDATILKGTFRGTGGEGWTDRDSVRIYRLESMLHNSYLLSSGSGTANATFDRIKGNDNYADGGTLYAITSCKYLYGIAATPEGKAMLTATIPKRYDINEIGAPEGSSRMPVPFWGIASFGSNGNLEATFSGLTALLRLSLADLPAGTRAIVLTTHTYTDLIGEGTPEDGDGEPLSGTFDTILEEGARLAANPIFYSYDTLRVNLGENASQYKNLYIPVVAGSYTALNVIAVTGDTRYAYEWQGKVLKVFRKDTPFRENTIVPYEPESTGIWRPRM